MSVGTIPRITEETPKRASSAWKAKHARILGAALDEFIEKGFNGASMDRIAAKAKVSKVTIYNHFENKDLLYRQMIEYYVTQVHPGAPALEATAGLTPRDVLSRYAVSLVEVTANARSIGMIRLLRSDPEAFGATSSGAGEARLLPDGRALAGYLQQEATQGRLRVQNPPFAARQLLGMLLENTLYPSLMGEVIELSRKNVQQVVDDCVDTFLAHYGAG